MFNFKEPANTLRHARTHMYTHRCPTPESDTAEKTHSQYNLYQKYIVYMDTQIQKPDTC